ncbi:hypothetical protein Ahia01_001161100 [Argonauta hians]
MLYKGADCENCEKPAQQMLPVSTIYDDDADDDDDNDADDDDDDDGDDDDDDDDADDDDALDDDDDADATNNDGDDDNAVQRCHENCEKPAQQMLPVSTIEDQQICPVHICDNTIKIEKSTTSKCSEFYSKVLEGYFLNRSASELTDISTSELQRKLLRWQKKPASSPVCVFTKHELKKTESCCDGYSGENCDTPVCYPPCQHGGKCDEPNICTCPQAYGGYRCDDRVGAVTHSMGYCYGGRHCFGEKSQDMKDVVYSYADCCRGNTAKSWGLTNSKCIPCEHYNNTNKDVVKKQHDLPFATCRNFGPYSYRTFDGLLYDFSGNCKYTLAVKPGTWSIDITIQNCSRLHTCRKRLDIRLTETKIVAQGHDIVIGSNRLDLSEGQYFNGTSFILKDNFVHIENAAFGLKVKFDNESSVYVTLQSSAKNRNIRGLCGNYNDNANDDLVTRENQNTTSTEEFANSFIIPDSLNPFLDSFFGGDVIHPSRKD